LRGRSRRSPHSCRRSRRRRSKTIALGPTTTTTTAAAAAAAAAAGRVLEGAIRASGGRGHLRAPLDLSRAHDGGRVRGGELPSQIARGVLVPGRSSSSNTRAKAAAYYRSNNIYC
jgi:hypothetical protein